MTTDNHPDPITEGLTHTGQRLVQILAGAAASREIYSRARQRLTGAQIARDDRAKKAIAAELDAAFNQARTVWSPAHDPDWLQHADIRRVATAMAAALPYAEDHVPAASAVRKCEDRLRQLHPHGMEHYDRFRRNGMSSLDAMLQAAPYFDNDPHTRTSEPVSRATLVEGSGADWSATEHGPTREGWEDQRREQRARQIVAELQQRLHTQGRDELRPDELRTVLSVTTNLTERIIAKVVPQEGDSNDHTRGAAEVAAEDHPLSIDEAMAMTAQQPHARPAAGKPHSPFLDRNQRPHR